MTEQPVRRSFVRVVGLGLLAGALAAAAGAKPWFSAAVADKAMPGAPQPDTVADMPLALALALVVLAAWGALLVTRGRVRRGVAGLAALAAAGLLACVVVAPLRLPDQVRGQLGAGSQGVAVDATGWYYAAAVAAVLALATTVLAWLRVPTWPTMATRYDAPTGAAPAPAEIDTDDPRSVWKALDDGRDPTDPEKG